MEISNYVMSAHCLRLPLGKHPYAIYTDFFSCKNSKFHKNNFDIFYIFAQSIDFGYTLEPRGEAVLTSSHNLCFGAIIRRIDIRYTPAYPSFAI